jgi:predicted dienelactone hydrolase
MKSLSSSVLLGALGLGLLACTTEIDVFTESSASSTGTTASSGAGGEGATTVASTGSNSTSSGVGGDASGVGGAGGSAGTGGTVELPPDPASPGPYTAEVLEETFSVAATGHAVKMRAVFPKSGPEMGPFPVVLVGHGFQTPISQYESYLQRLASFGYVAVAPDYPAPFIGNKHTDNARDLAAGLDWVAQQATLKTLASVDNAGATGHSLGGKVSVLAASFDKRIKASITLDPVDSSFLCSAMDCPDASNTLPLGIPMGFLGETIDATAASAFAPACAPAADNFTTFFAKASAPSLSVEVLGASHLSFVDNPLSGLCKAPTAKNEDVLALSRAMVVAFYERHLKGKVSYDTYLTGSEAQKRYVDTKLALIQSK